MSKATDMNLIAVTERDRVSREERKILVDEEYEEVLAYIEDIASTGRLSTYIKVEHIVGIRSRLIEDGFNIDGRSSFGLDVSWRG